MPRRVRAESILLTRATAAATKNTKFTKNTKQNLVFVILAGFVIFVPAAVGSCTGRG